LHFYLISLLVFNTGKSNPPWHNMTQVIQAAPSCQLLSGRRKSQHRYRTRFVVKLSGPPNWDKAHLRCESNWMEDEGWIAGYDSRLLEEMYGDIRGKIGRVRR
jgi:hypothetical protein